MTMYECQVGESQKNREKALCAGRPTYVAFPGDRRLRVAQRTLVALVAFRATRQHDGCTLLPPSESELSPMHTPSKPCTRANGRPSAKRNCQSTTDTPRRGHATGSKRTLG